MRRVTVTGWSRPPLGRVTKIILLVNLAIFLVELVAAYLLDFDTLRLRELMLPLYLWPKQVVEGWVWQLLTYMWIHDPDVIGHIGFNMLVLYFFGPSLEQQWGRRRYLRNYVLFGLGGAAAVMLTGLLLWLFDAQQPPVLGASAAIAGLVAAFCIDNWNTVLKTFFIEMKGRTLLIIFIIIDVIRLVAGEPIAVQAHWGGMLTALIVVKSDWVDPRLLRLRLRRWRLRRRLRLERGGEDGQSGGPTLH
jgi:membrane associated rhomboid family serine protease